MNGVFYEAGIKPLEALTLRNLRQELLSEVQGKALEIGVGTGLNLDYYPARTQVTGIDPDEEMLKVAKKRLHQDIELIKADAQDLPFPDETFDTVIGTLVLCTVPDPDKAIHEAFRVLKRGGQFLLLEHIRKDSLASGKFLDLMTPFWKVIAGGCHLNRDPLPSIIKIGFEVKSSRLLWKGLGRFLILEKPQG